jgi:hypothetical protein
MNHSVIIVILSEAKDLLFLPTKDKSRSLASLGFARDRSLGMTEEI